MLDYFQGSGDFHDEWILMCNGLQVCGFGGIELIS
jgi:hypothetical protein